MTNQEKEDLIYDTLYNLKESIFVKINDMPEDWDGLEIKEFIKDYYEAHFNYMRMPRNRRIKYNNDLQILNLI